MAANGGEWNFVQRSGVCYACADISKTAQRCQSDRKLPSRPLHRFANVLGRVPLAQRKKLEAIEEKYLGWGKEVTAAYKQGVIGKAMWSEQRASFGTKLAQEICKILINTEFNQQDDCVEHGGCEGLAAGCKVVRVRSG